MTADRAETGAPGAGGGETASEQAGRGGLRGYARTGVVKRCVEMGRTDAGSGDVAALVTALSETMFLVRGADGVYLNMVDAPCPGAGGRARRIAPAATGAALCRNDRVDVIDRTSGETLASCALGDFEMLLKTASPPDRNALD